MAERSQFQVLSFKFWPSLSGPSNRSASHRTAPVSEFMWLAEEWKPPSCPHGLAQKWYRYTLTYHSDSDMRSHWIFGALFWIFWDKATSSFDPDPTSLSLAVPAKPAQSHHPPEDWRFGIVQIVNVWVRNCFRMLFFCFVFFSGFTKSSMFLAICSILELEAAISTVFETFWSSNLSCSMVFARFSCLSCCFGLVCFKVWLKIYLGFV